MEGTAVAESQLYRAYRADLEGERMVRANRDGALIVAILVTAFIAVDWIVFPSSLGVLLQSRLFCDLVMAVIFFWSARAFPVPSAVVGCFTVGAVLLTVIAVAGGVTSDYSPGLMLLFLGMPVLLPLTARQAAGIVIVLSGALALMPLVTGEQVYLQSYLVHLAFPLAAGAESVIACGLLDGMRFAEFQQLREIERARDELKELDREKSRFTANVHHELRTPLTLMLAPLDAMLEGSFGAVSDMQRGYLKTMHTNAQRLLKLINNLLDLAKIEGDQLRVKRRPLQLEGLVEELVASARPLAERKAVVIETVGLADLPTVNADADALEKVIVNLLGNALKFTPEGGRIEIRGESGPDGGVELVVVDSGEGIASNQLEKIFDRFAQVDSSNTRRHEGTGIGLALVKELIELHGGRVRVESEGRGHGSRFYVSLPQGEPDVEVDDDTLETSTGRTVGAADGFAAIESELDLDVAALETAAAPDEPARLRLAEMERSVERAESAASPPENVERLERVAKDAPEVLIVEDNGDMRKLLSFIVGQEYRVRLARNGREGLEKTREQRPDLVLTDVMMPEMSGTELCHHLKADPDTWGIPVVLVTSKAEREMKVRGLERGADDYVTKPFHPRELMARIRSLLRVRVLQQELAVRNALLESTNEELVSTLSELKEAGVQLVQAERLAAVGELAAGVAHEVNNPINFATNALKTLRTYVEDIRSVAAKVSEMELGDAVKLRLQALELDRMQKELDFEGVAGALAELVEIVTEGLDRTHRLVGDLRDFAAPGDGHHTVVNVARGLRSTVQLVNHAAKSAGVELAIDVPETLPAVVGDARALNQVFLNLVKNAIEALADEGGSVAVSARTDGRSVLVDVVDDGPGIDPAHREQLFEPFFSTKGAGRGTGLGLSISRRVVLEHGGAIEVDPTPGRGARFTVILPTRKVGRELGGQTGHAA